MTRLISLTSLFVLLLSPVIAVAQAPNAIKTANYFMWAREGLEDPTHIAALAQYDLLVLPAEAQVYNQPFFAEIRERNPDIILLPYIATTSYSHEWNDPLHDTLLAGIQDQWKLHDTSGEPIAVWPNTFGLDISSGWNDYLVDFAIEEVYGSGLWDGIFYDEVNDVISHHGNAELSNSLGDPDDAWEQANIDLFQKTRERLEEDALILTNGSSNLVYAPYVNGRMFESFPTPGEGDWLTNIQNTVRLVNNIADEAIMIFNSDTNNTGNQEDYRAMRLGLTSSLLTDAYFGFDFGTTSHGQIWHYDEYDAFLGEAIGPPTQTARGVWQRQFERGIVFVNPTDQERTVTLSEPFETLHGTQDVSTNTGELVSTVTLGERDGRILLRPIKQLLDSVFLNGTTATVFNASGQIFRSSFPVENDRLPVKADVVTTDMDSDGNLEQIVAHEGNVSVYTASGDIRTSFHPYTTAYNDDVHLAVQDINHDGTAEIITVGGGLVRVFDEAGTPIGPGFFPYDDVYRGSIEIDVGDLNGDGFVEIITGAGTGGGPHIRVFNQHGKLIHPGFFAYDASLRTGVHLSVGDVNDDGVDEIVTLARSGKAEVRVFDRNGTLILEPFTAFDRTAFGIERISVTDLDGDMVEEIVILTNASETFAGFGTRIEQGEE